MPPGNRILLLTAPEERATFSSLEGDGLIVSYSDDLQVIETIPLEETPNLLLLDLSLVSPGSLGGFARRCKEADMPILALVPSDSQASVDPRLEVEDFVFFPLRTPSCGPGSRGRCGGTGVRTAGRSSTQETWS